AEGSLRDALSLLDTAIAYGNGRLEAAMTAELLGVSTPAAVGAFAGALLGRDTTGALEAIDRAAREGEDLHAFARDIVELLRRVLVLKAAPTAKLVDLTHAEGNELRKLGEGTTLDEILYVIRAFLEADALMRESPHPRVEDEVMKKRPMLGTVLTQARPGGVSDGELTIVLTGNHFHRETLADTANREIVVQAVRRHVAGADRITVVAAGESAGGAGEHP